MAAFDGRAIIVTGASSGIGRVTAVTLGAMGAELWLVGRDAGALDETAAEIAARGGPPAHSAPMDLAERGPLAALVAEVGANHPHLFALVNNAGLMYPEPIMSGGVDRWQAMIDVNVMATLEGSQAAVAAMRSQGKPGHVVNVGSLQARFEVPGVYGITKKAIEMIGASLRAELEDDDIRVSTIIPGGFATQLARGFQPTELEKIAENFNALDIDLAAASERVIGDPQHIADAIVYVLSQPTIVNIQEMLVRPPVDTKV